MAVIGTAILLLVAPALAEEESDYAGAEMCAACHDDVIEAFKLTPHATGHGWDHENGCEGCHGPGAAHAESADPDDLVLFRDLTPQESSERCLACHRKSERQFNTRRGIHHLNQVACTACHTAHSTATNLMDNLSIELCGSCHQGVVAEFSLPRSHPLPETGRRREWTTGLTNPQKSVSCEGCHEPHSSSSLRTSAGMGNFTCGKCHAEKNGPFLYPHDVGIVDGCQACHRVHGSPNRHLLTHERQINLCYECHAGSTMPGFHSLGSFVNRKCTACHTAIHGSNTHPSFRER
jgi:DmsE family decaheme c-type cytochrome